MSSCARVERRRSSLGVRRAVFTKANVQKGQNVLITGIGGGVAITALQYCIALGARRSYFSQDKELTRKCRRQRLGLLELRGQDRSRRRSRRKGRNQLPRRYVPLLLPHSPLLTLLSATWPKTLAALLPKNRPYLDAVIDSGGGPIANQVTRVRLPSSWERQN